MSMSPPLVSWMVVAVVLAVAEALLVYLLRRVQPEICLRVALPGGCLGGFERVGLALGVVTARSRVGGERR
jgi:hypothetical protein